MRELAAVAIGVVVALAALGRASVGPETRFDELALGASTSSFYAKRGEYPIHCRTLEDADACIRGFRARGGGRVVLWLGNSQLHAVNQLKPGEETAAAVLSRRLAASDRDLLTFSQPNANLQEHWLLFSHLRRSLPVEWLLLPVVFDDLRETGIRAELAPALDKRETRVGLAASEVGRRILAVNAEKPADDFAALAETVQEAVETGMNGWLENHVRLWAQRPELRGRLFSKLHELRNATLGITAQSRRKLIRGRYDLNMAALEAMLDEATANGIRTLVYIVPLRDDVEVPYDEAEYAQFQSEVEALAHSRGAAFANLASIVPGEFWGMKDSTSASGQPELDFMHFQASGHAILARALGDRLEAEMRRDTR